MGPLFPIDESTTERSQVDPALLTQKIIDYSNSTEASSVANTTGMIDLITCSPITNCIIAPTSTGSEESGMLTC